MHCLNQSVICCHRNDARPQPGVPSTYNITNNNCQVWFFQTSCLRKFEWPYYMSKSVFSQHVLSQSVWVSKIRQPPRFCRVLCIARSVSYLGKHAQLTRCFSEVAELLVSLVIIANFCRMSFKRIVSDEYYLFSSRHNLYFITAVRAMAADDVTSANHGYNYKHIVTLTAVGIHAPTNHLWPSKIFQLCALILCNVAS